MIETSSMIEKLKTQLRNNKQVMKQLKADNRDIQKAISRLTKIGTRSQGNSETVPRVKRKYTRRKRRGPGRPPKQEQAERGLAARHTA